MNDARDAKQRPFLSNRRLGWLAAVTAMVVAIAFFVADNFVIVRVRVFTLDLQVRLAWVMLVCLLCGMVIGATVTWLLSRGRR
jgi:hypothetical protein